MKIYFIILALATLWCSIPVYAQNDSAITQLQQLPKKYITTVNTKIEQYSGRVTSKTVKTLTKLSKWETKIKRTLERVNSEASNKLFGNGRLTFESLLQKIKQSEQIPLNFSTTYDKYRDEMTTRIKYLEESKTFLDSGLAKKMNIAKQKIQQLNDDEDRAQAIQQFIKERKNELITTAIKHVANSKYLSKINREAWYYGETIKNYKEIFSDETKIEETVTSVLNRIPAFKKFITQNSMLAGLFNIQSGNAELQPGMQTRNNVQQLIQSRIASMGPNAEELIKQNLQTAHDQLNNLKDNIIKNSLANGGSGYGEMPDFKPNNQKTKTFKQRIEYNFNVQFSKSNGLIPSGADVALGIGYKLNDKSSAGLGASYKLGIGSIDNLNFSNEGLGLRSFIDWKLKKQFYVSGGFEMNYNEHYKDADPLKANSSPWQKAALLGLTKKLSMKSKWFKTANIQVLYDFLAHQHIPVSQTIIFRIGYTF